MYGVTFEKLCTPKNRDLSFFFLFILISEILRDLKNFQTIFEENLKEILRNYEEIFMIF